MKKKEEYKEHIPAVLIEMDYKGYFKRYALTPEEFQEEFKERLESDMPEPTNEGDGYTLRPMVHIWYCNAAVGDDLWKKFFTDMEWGMSEGDIASGNVAYIEHCEMKSLSPYVPVEIDHDASVYYTVETSAGGAIMADDYTHFVQKFESKDSGYDTPREIVYVGTPKKAFNVADHLNAKESSYGELLAENIYLRNEFGMQVLTGDAAEYNNLMEETQELKQKLQKIEDAEYGMAAEEHSQEKLVYKTPYGGEYEVSLKLNMYSSNDNLYIGMDYFDQEYGCMLPYGDVTVNTELKMPYLYAAIDNNNNGTSIVPFLIEHGFGHDTGRVVESGYCQFPIFKFSETALKRIDAEAFSEYQNANIETLNARDRKNDYRQNPAAAGLVAEYERKLIKEFLDKNPSEVFYPPSKVFTRFNQIEGVWEFKWGLTAEAAADRVNEALASLNMNSIDDWVEENQPHFSPAAFQSGTMETKNERYNDFCNFMSQFGNFGEDELKEMYEAEMLVEHDL